MVEIARRQRRQTRGQTFGRRMGEPAQHDMGDTVELVLDRIHDVRVAIAMAYGPPGGDAVDQFASVRQPQPNPLCSSDFQRFGRRFHLRIGPPDMQAVRIGCRGGRGVTCIGIHARALAGLNSVRQA